MSELAQKTCLPCQGGVPPIGQEERIKLLAELDNWEIVDDHHLSKSFDFPNFKTALAFTNAVGEIAEEENHHPDIHLAWGKVRVDIWTHKIDNLVEADFILAAKIDKIS